MSTEAFAPTRVSLGRMFRALSPYLQRSRLLFLLSALSITVATAAELALPYLVGKATDALVVQKAVEPLLHFCSLFLIACGIRALAEAGQSWTMQRAGQRFTAELRSALFSHVLRAPLSFFDSNASGKIATRVIYDVRALGEVFTAAVSVLLLDVLLIVATAGAMLAYDVRLAVCALLPFPILLVALVRIGPKLGNAYRDSRARLSELNGFLGEHLGAVPTIQQLAAERDRDERLAKVADSYEAAQRSAVHLFSLIQPVTNVVNGLSTAAVLGFGGWVVAQGHLTPGVVVAFLGYLKNLFQPIRDLVEKYNLFLAAQVAGERVAAMLEAPVERQPDVLAPGPVASALVRNERDVDAELTAAPEIVFDGVSFGYAAQADVIRKVSFSLPAGGTIAVVGPTGSGKSSLLRLLLGFYQPREGRILVDGRDVREFSTETLRSRTAYVSQEVYLFRGTLRENLELIRPGVPDPALQRACERVRLWSLVADRGGLDFALAEGGANLSSGERQLVALARACVRDAPLFLFDEATANLDGALERVVGAVAFELFQGRTAIVIAHRLETVMRCPTLVFLEQGEVREIGDPRQLREGNGAFAAWLRSKESAATG